jgi:hypothetical protein
LRSISSIKRDAPDVSGEIDRIVDALKDVPNRARVSMEQRLKTLGLEIAELSFIPDVDSMMYKAIERTPPFEEKGEGKGFRDELIMQTILEGDCSGQSVILISQDAMFQRMEGAQFSSIHGNVNVSVFDSTASATRYLDEYKTLWVAPARLEWVKTVLGLTFVVAAWMQSEQWPSKKKPEAVLKMCAAADSIAKTLGIKTINVNLPERGRERYISLSRV